MKTIAAILVSVILSLSFATSAFAENAKMFSSADSVADQDRTVTRIIKGYSHDGYTEVSRSMQNIYYFAPCQSDCKWGEITIVMVSPETGNYSLERTYAYIHVSIMQDFETGGYYCDKVWIEEQQVF